MNLKRWLADNRLRVHKTNKREIRDFFALVQRDLDDASYTELSPDRRFMIAYDAALTLATIPLYCAGYETHGGGHHWMTFKLLPEVMGKAYSEMADYLDLCRTKRNVGTYDRGGQISSVEAEELISEVIRFRDEVHGWVLEHHPELT
jgi:hypothetical protein